MKSQVLFVVYVVLIIKLKIYFTEKKSIKNSTSRKFYWEIREILLYRGFPRPIWHAI